MLIIKEAFSTIFSVTKKEKESLQDYTRQFKTAKDVLDTHLGGMTGYSTGGDIEKYSKEARNQFVSYLYMENSDKVKYGSITRSLN